MVKGGRTKRGKACVKVYALSHARKDDFAEFVEIIGQNWGAACLYKTLPARFKGQPGGQQ